MALQPGNDGSSCFVFAFGISISIPPSWQLASDEAAERQSLWNEDAPNKPFTGRLSSGVTLVTILEFEFRGLLFRKLHRFEVARKLDFLIKAFHLGVVTSEQLGL